MLNIMKYYKFWMGVSAALLIVGIVCLAVFGLRLGIDFKGGTLTQVAFKNNRPTITDIQSALREKGFNEAHIQPTGDKSVIIRTGPDEKEAHDKLLKAVSNKFVRVTEKEYTCCCPVICRTL